MKKLFKSKTFYTFLIVIILVVVGYIKYAENNKPTYKFVTVSKGTVIQTVSVTGKTQAVQSLQLAFERSGKIAKVYATEGDRITEGQLLASLDTQDLNAQFAQAKANIDAQTARLADLKRGPRPEDIRVKETALEKARQDLENMFQGVPTTIGDAYIKSDDTIRKQTGGIFTDGDTSPKLAFLVNDSQIKTDLENRRLQINQELVAWKSSIASLPLNPSQDETMQAISGTSSHLVSVREFLDSCMNAVVQSVGVSSSTADGYKTNITLARTNINTALTNINNEKQSIASQKIVVRQAEDNVALARVGTTPEAIAAAEAAVAQAVAGTDAITAQLSGTHIRSPIAGLVTNQNAKVGQVANAHDPLISVISDKKLEIEANVPEVDIGKVATGNTVRITLDAFPSETFTGKVTFIDPGETIVGGVVNYKIKVLFDRHDERFKSGLTANLNIVSKEKSGVLTVPNYAIVENDMGTFVKIVENSVGKDIPVKLGIRDQSNGIVEIVNGISENQQVVNIGVKQTK